MNTSINRMIYILGSYTMTIEWMNPFYITQRVILHSTVWCVSWYSLFMYWRQQSIHDNYLIFQNGKFLWRFQYFFIFFKSKAWTFLILFSLNLLCCSFHVLHLPWSECHASWLCYITFINQLKYIENVGLCVTF